MKRINVKFKFGIFLLTLFTLSSCKPYEVIFDDEQLSAEYQKKLDTSFEHYSLCVIFDTSMAGTKVGIQDFNSREVIFNGTLEQWNERIGISKFFLLFNNSRNYIMYINNDFHYIEADVYKKHRYLVISKKNPRTKKYILTYSNMVINDDYFHFPDDE